MKADSTAVFFYGLFMDEQLLVSKGFEPSGATVAHVDGYALRIGKRASLAPQGTARSYGVLMTMRVADLQALYSGEGLSDYVPETVQAVKPDGTRVPALCYNLPEDRLGATSADYAKSLHALARKLGLPEAYLRHIERQLA